MRKYVLLAALLFLAAACGQSETGDAPAEPTTTAPVTTAPDTPVSSGSSSSTTSIPPGQKGQAFVDSVDLLLLESYPVQVMASLHGSLPTPCHRLAWEVGEPGPGGRIELKVYSTFDPAQVCAQVLQPFEENIPVGSYTSGSYVLVIDGVEYPFSI
jgi:inhibitor of cysteine peptidase